MPDADRTVIATRVTFTAIALNLDWGERRREVVVRCLRALGDAGRLAISTRPPPSWGGGLSYDICVDDSFLVAA